MNLRSLLVSALLASSSMAMDFEDWDRLNKRTLVPVRRQPDPLGSGFKPGSNSGSGATCSDAFGAGFMQCGTGNECYNPSAGESCCSDTYPCPSGSFCLSDGLCCPDGLTAAECEGTASSTSSSAAATTSTSTSSSSASSSSASSSSASSSAHVSKTTVSPTKHFLELATGVSSAVSSAIIAPSSGSNYTVIPTGGATTIAPTLSASATPSPPPFTSGAGSQRAIGGAAALVGLLGVVGLVL